MLAQNDTSLLKLWLSVLATKGRANLTMMAYHEIRVYLIIKNTCNLVVCKYFEDLVPISRWLWDSFENQFNLAEIY